MRLRLLALAFASALLPAGPASAAAAPVGACTSLVTVCVGGCSSGDVIRVQVIGVGYGDAKCGGATASCTSPTIAGCTGRAHAAYGSSWTRCLADPAGTGVTVAICRSEPFVN